jgi:hypothetical protein
MLQDWLRSGPSIRGYTLQPSPYILDLLLDRLVVLFTNDFERYVYVVSAVVSICFAGSLLLLGYAYCRDWRRAAVISLISYASLYLFLIPLRIYQHLFIPSHTFALIATPVAMAMLAASLTSDSRRSIIRWYAALSALTMIVVFSDPIFIADFIVPGAMACGLLAILPRTRVPRLALSGFVPCASGAIAMILLEACNVFFWPHRVDVYAPVFTITNTGDLQVNGNAGLFAIILDKRYRTFLRIFVIAFLGVALWWVAQFKAYCARPWEPQAIQKRRLELMAMTAVGLLATVTSVAMPALRGSFQTHYEWRYFLLASIFLSFGLGGAITYAGVAAWSLLTAHANKHLSKRFLPRWPTPVFRFAPALGVALSCGVFLITICYCAGNSTRLGDKHSTATPYLSCVSAVTKRENLHDGMASAYAASMLRAGRAAPQFRHSGKIFQTTFTDLFSYLEPANNNLKWMSRAALEKDGGVDYVIFEEGRDIPAAQDNIRRFVGEPALVATCPDPNNKLADGVHKTYIWVYRDSDARRRLTNLVLWDNNREVFFPSYRLGSLVVNPIFGAFSVPGEGSVLHGMRGWTRDTDRPEGRFFQTKPIYLPAGKYRAHICLSTNDRASKGPLATAEVSWGGKILFRQDVGQAKQDFIATFDLNTKGGPTSGNTTLVTLFAGKASDVEVCGLTIERYDRGEFFRPLSIFE